MRPNHLHATDNEAECDRSSYRGSGWKGGRHLSDMAQTVMAMAWMAMAQTVGINGRVRVIGVSSK